jgi:hypothetical protein
MTTTKPDSLSAGEGGNAGGLDPEFVAEMRERLLMIAGDAYMSRRHTHFGGEVRRFSTIIKVAANCFGRPTAPSPGVRDDEA